MGGPSKERMWGETIRHADERARQTRYVADVAACEAWNYGDGTTIRTLRDAIGYLGKAILKAEHDHPGEDRQFSDAR